MTPEECSRLILGDLIVHNGEVLMVTGNDADEEEVRLARVAFSVGKVRYSSLSTGCKVDRS
jgi:hypothetical protein